ncbi:MAG: hypothetical protein EOO78_07125, partial [Oxalobacteraceae bacterium]
MFIRLLTTAALATAAAIALPLQAAQFARHLGPDAVVGERRSIGRRRYGGRDRVHFRIGPGR